jgi:hypothetical protein
MDKKVYIDNMCNGAFGLGNRLFQICAAIHYCETYGYSIVIRKTMSTLFGTSNDFGKTQCYKDESGVFAGYDKTIFKKLTYTEDMSPIGAQDVYNFRSNNKIIPSGNDLIISGYNQCLDLFIDHLQAFPKYLHLDDAPIKAYIAQKYGDVSKGICVGIRIGADFAHMTKLKSSSYLKALHYLQNYLKVDGKVYIISDTPDIHKHGFDLGTTIEVNEPDIVQLYFGLMCQHYILSESTFHLWIAYLGTIDKSLNKQVICFNDTDITNISFDLPGWIKMNY